MESSEKSTAACTENSWQEEAAGFLLRSGFRPCDTVGNVEHMANPHRVGRTFGSVWHAMRSLVEGGPESSASEAQEVWGEPLSKSGDVCVGSKTELGPASPADATPVWRCPRLMQRRSEAAVNEERMAWKALNESDTHQRAALQELWEQAAKRLTKISAEARLDGKSKWWVLWRRQ